MIYIKLIILFSLLIISFYILYYALNMLQQEHYDIKKLLLHFPKMHIKLFYLAIYFIAILMVKPNIYHLIFILLSVIAVLLFEKKYIIKLKLTKRILRLIFILLIELIIPFFFSSFHLWIFIIEIILLPYLVIIANIIASPIEVLIKRKYIKCAKKALNENKSLLIIGITGSYGKTSCKNIINHILQDFYLVLSTPKSYNTLMGITKTITESLKKTTEILILELGAFRRGEIKQMVSLAKPKVSLITDIGQQHLSTFKTLENVKLAKLEIISEATFDDTLVLNGDNEYLRNEKIISIKDIVYAGISPENMIYAKDIKYIDGKMHFLICNKRKILVNVSTNLLGMHNVKNILLSYAVIMSLSKYNINITNKMFEEKIKTLAPIPHRLEYKAQNNVNLYDDSYSSNIQGFLQAIKFFENLKEPKVIITPGIVDTGSNAEVINKQVASNMLNKFTDIYLIKNKATSYFEEVFKKNNQKYYIYKSFKEAYKSFIKSYEGKEVNLLIENDLPDNFLER